MRSDPGLPLKREKKVTFILLLFACSDSINSSDTFDTSITDTDVRCIDGRGYEHQPGTFWQCDNLCITCTCTGDGEIIHSPDGPKIVDEDCKDENKSIGPQLPPSPK